MQRDGFGECLISEEQGEKSEKGKCTPESRDLLPGSTPCDVRGSYREVFFFVVAFFIRTAAFFAGFFLAILGMRSPP
jgi:hypothetical protein